MASRFYDSSGKEVYDGNIAYANDVNQINISVNTAFEQVADEIDTVNNDAETWAQSAESWAVTAEDTEVEPGKYSALHYAEKASDSATAASGSASTASSAASTAGTHATNAETYKNAALAAQGAAETAETNAETAQTAAETAQGLAEAAQSAAETAETNAETAETNAETARDFANEWATKAEDSQVNDGVNPAGYSAYHWAQKSQGFASNSPYPIDTLQAKGSVSGAVACDVSSYDTFTMTITAATTLSFTNIATGRTFTLVLTNAGTNITWPATVKWPGGEEPELSASGTDRVVLQQVGTSNIHASLAGAAYA